MLVVPTELTRRYEARLAQQNLMAGQRPHITSGYAMTWTSATSIASRRRIA